MNKLALKFFYSFVWIFYPKKFYYPNKNNPNEWDK